MYFITSKLHSISIQTQKMSLNISPFVYKPISQYDIVGIGFVRYIITTFVTGENIYIYMYSQLNILHMLWYLNKTFSVYLFSIIFILVLAFVVETLVQFILFGENILPSKPNYSYSK